MGRVGNRTHMGDLRLLWCRIRLRRCHDSGRASGASAMADIWCAVEPPAGAPARLGSHTATGAHSCRLSLNHDAGAARPAQPGTRVDSEMHRCVSSALAAQRSPRGGVSLRSGGGRVTRADRERCRDALLGHRDSSGAEFFDHPDGHPHQTGEGHPPHHESPHVHAVDSHGNELIVTYPNPSA